MPRGGASMQAGVLYHVISRFVAKEWFVRSSTERRRYLEVLGRALAEIDWSCIAYAVMSNHIHLALVAGTPRLEDWMRGPHTAFAEWINRRLERIGGVFVRGPNVWDVRPEGTARLLNYIHLNPVRAGVVARPEDCDWTSHRAYVEASLRPRWLDVERGLALAGFASPTAFADWMAGTRIDRAALDEVQVHPQRPRGRSPKVRNPPEQEAGFFVAGAGLSRRQRLSRISSCFASVARRSCGARALVDERKIGPRISLEGPNIGANTVDLWASRGSFPISHFLSSRCFMGR